MFDSKAKLLMVILPEDVVLKIHYIGSTSLIELAAKAIIDILMKVRNLNKLNNLLT